MSADQDASYGLPEAWMAESMEPLSKEAKDLATRSWDEALAAARQHGADLPESLALSMMTGIAVQFGMQLIAKAIELQQGVHPVHVANYMAGEIRNSTLITFAQMLSMLHATQGQRPS